ncbi:RNA dependent RNA polymerase-domain-containing protein [Hygrophoropsis aurantiaca]|uniref:RNA dependent RNA polymerase-domain-containing protein n=1 Tax=Hygrophoropsis aurantiaca TaxID=72124 RepID=A0ACB8AGL3_9AGAM|nr:RNA dependent RNA polymerase-domain-containing protein [Hygrophoropsis aurantiaca]
MASDLSQPPCMDINLERDVERSPTSAQVAPYLDQGSIDILHLMADRFISSGRIYGNDGLEIMDEDANHPSSDLGLHDYARHERLKADTLIPRSPSSESLSSTQSTSYSAGFEDLTEIMIQIPEELCNFGIARNSTGGSGSPTQISQVSETVSPPTGSLLSNESLILGKRKPDDTLSSVSLKKVRTNDSESSAFIIAHCPHLQGYFDAQRISFGVQWLVARLTTLDPENRIDYDQIGIPDLLKLQGTNENAAPRTTNVLRHSVPSDTAKEMRGFFAKEMAATTPWRELDQEHELAFKKPSFDGFHRQLDGWYGGKVQFTAKLKLQNENKTNKHTGNPQYRIQLNWPEIGPSTRFKRQFGSKNFFRVQISKTILNMSDNRLVDFFSQRFALCGLIYRAFFAKDNNVFMVATDELAPQMASLPFHADPRPPAFMDFLNWHNPIESNLSQSMTKWATRFALGLSNSVPGLPLEKSNIQHMADEVHNGSDMTDGCGFINKAALKTLQTIFDWDSCPTAIQCRIGGAKGLLLLHPEAAANDCDISQVWLRDSQIKVKFPADATMSAGHLTIDVLRASHLSTPSRLSAETIINLAENGVPHDSFVDLVKRDLDTIVDELLDWDGSDAMYKLWSSVARSGHVFPARLAREAGGEARAKGFRVKDAEDDVDDDLGDDLGHPHSTAWWGDEISGCPSSLEETVMAFLDAGFSPQSCPVLADKIRHIIRTSAENYVQRHRLQVPMSLVAWIVPDPTGLLAPDEIYISSRECKLLNADGTQTNIILGDVLLTRHPCKLPTDTQKVKAVEKRELRQYTDVIICPTQGMRRFADLLAGGDYDGDKAIAIWDPNIVQHFTNADLKYSTPAPDFLKDNFVKESLSAHTFWEENKHKHSELLLPLVQKFLLGGLRDTSLVGKYSNFHDLAIYLKGYNHSETIRLAYMFCHVLDASKTGLVVLPNILAKDSKNYQRRAPAWKETPAERDKQTTSNTVNPHRPRDLHNFVMDKIFDSAEAYRDIKLKRMSDVFAEKASEARDVALVKPWEDVLARARKIRDARHFESSIIDKEIELIRSHVKNMRKAHSDKVGHAHQFTNHKIEHRQDILRAIARDFALKPPIESFVFFSPDELATLKASYAYSICHVTHRFPWDVAMRELGTIKAKSLGPFKTVQLGFYERFMLK